MKVLVLGGTGAMGAFLVGELNRDPDVEQVLVTSRTARMDVEKIRYIQGNAKDDAFLFRLLNEGGFDAIVDFMSYQTDEFARRVDRLLSSTGHYLFLSSSRVYADSGLVRLTEDYPRLLDAPPDRRYLKTDEYALAKARQENLLRASSRKNYTIVRPYITYSEERLQLGIYEKEQWLYRAMQGRPIVFSEDLGKRHTTLTWGGDVARYQMKLLKLKPSGASYHIASEQAVTWGDILAIYLGTMERVTGKRPELCSLRSTYVPTPQIYQFLYDRSYDRLFSMKKLEEAIGEKAVFAPAEEKLTECLTAFLTGRSQFREIRWGNEAEMDRLTHTRQSVRSIPGWTNRLRYVAYSSAPGLVRGTKRVLRIP